MATYNSCLSLIYQSIKLRCMEDLKNPNRVKQEIARRVEEKIQREENFLKNYDRILNQYILNECRKPGDASHDHWAHRMIGDELIELRLDTLNGEADGIKVFFEKEKAPMYIWFSPNVAAEKIVFKIVCNGKTAIEQYLLEDISEGFLLGMITVKYMSQFDYA